MAEPIVYSDIVEELGKRNIYFRKEKAVPPSPEKKELPIIPILVGILGIGLLLTAD